MMPPPVNRDYPVHMILDINTTTQTSNVSPSHKYTWWTFDGTVPGPVVRCRVGDVLEVRYSNMVSRMQQYKVWCAANRGLQPTCLPRLHQLVAIMSVPMSMLNAC